MECYIKPGERKGSPLLCNLCINEYKQPILLITEEFWDLRDVVSKVFLNPDIIHLPAPQKRWSDPNEAFIHAWGYSWWVSPVMCKPWTQGIESRGDSRGSGWFSGCLATLRKTRAWRELQLLYRNRCGFLHDGANRPCVGLHYSNQLLGWFPSCIIIVPIKTELWDQCAPYLLLHIFLWSWRWQVTITCLFLNHEHSLNF